jgi:lipopolysaccharide export system ATP-binding protein
MSYKLEVDSIIKKFDEKTLLNDISLTCNIGEVIAIFGRNGAGKSTLFKIIFGTENADNKFVRINNRVLQKPYLLQNGVQYLSQDAFLPKQLTVETAAKLFLGKAKLKSFFKDEFLNDFVHTKVAALSKGVIRYLEIKLVLKDDCHFCLLDEPYQGVSPLVIEHINRLIVETKPKKGIIISDHNYSNALAIADRFYLLKDGFLKAVASQEELVSGGYLNP